MTAHSPLPWVAHPDGAITSHDVVVAIVEGGNILGDFAALVQADAAFIVRAVNAHDALVAAAQDVLIYSGDPTGQCEATPPCLDCVMALKLRAAIAQATGSEGAGS